MFGPSRQINFLDQPGKLTAKNAIYLNALTKKIIFCQFAKYSQHLFLKK